MTSSPISCSVQLLTWNSEGTIKRCLDSLTGFAEVVMMDGRSTDRTREIAKEYANVKIVDQDAESLDADGRIADFSGVRNAGLGASTYEWILMVDSDEGVTKDLEEEVRAIVIANVPGAYRVFRRFIVDGEPVIRCAGYPAYHIRFFHRSLVTGYIKSVHERPAVKPGVVVQALKTELPVPLPPPHDLESKYERYLQMEVARLGVMPWGRWFRWVLYRNLRSALGLAVLAAGVWIVPGKGKRMPIAYDWQAIRQSLKTIWGTFPPLAKRRLPT